MSGSDLVDEERPRAAGGWFADVLRTWLPAILLVLVIRTFVFEPFRIPSGSMVPTLLIGDHVVVNKSSYGLWVPATVVEVPFMETAWVVPRFELVDWGNPERGDIIVFRYPKDESLNYIKRVVAVPGDRIRVKSNQIFLDDVPQDRVSVGTYEFVEESCRTKTLRHFVEDLDGLEHDILTDSVPRELSTWPRGDQEIVVPPDSVFVMGDNRDNSEDSRRWEFVRYDQIKGKAHFVWFSWDGCQDRVRANRFFDGLYREPEATPAPEP